MDESGGRVTRLRRRLSTELLDETSSPLTPTKKRVAKLAVKPQLDNINENAVVESPKRVTRRSLAADVEVKSPTPVRRSARIKSNTSLTDVLEISDSPRAKRVTRRTSMTSLQTESLTPNTPAKKVGSARMSLDSAQLSQGEPKFSKKKAENPRAIKQKANDEKENFNGTVSHVVEDKAETITNQKNPKDGTVVITSKISDLESDVLDKNFQNIPTGLSVDVTPVRKSPRLSSKLISPTMPEATKTSEVNSRLLSNKENAEKPDMDISIKILLEAIEDRSSKSIMSITDPNIKINKKSERKRTTSAPNNEKELQSPTKFMSDTELIKKNANKFYSINKTHSKSYGSDTKLNLSLSKKRNSDVINKFNEENIANESVEPMEVDETLPETFNISLFDKIYKSKTFLPVNEKRCDDSLDEVNLSNKHGSTKLVKDLVVQIDKCDTINHEQNSVFIGTVINQEQINPKDVSNHNTLNNSVVENENLDEKSLIQTSKGGKISTDNSRLNKSATDYPMFNESSNDNSKLDESSTENSKLDKISKDSSKLDRRSTQNSKLDKSSTENLELNISSTKSSKLDTSATANSKLERNATENTNLDISSIEISKRAIKSNGMFNNDEATPKNSTSKINKKLASLGISTSTPVLQESQTKKKNSSTVDETLINRDSSEEDDSGDSSNSNSKTRFVGFEAEDAGDDYQSSPPVLQESQTKKKKNSTVDETLINRDSSEEDDSGDSSNSNSKTRFVGFEAEDAGDDYQSGDSQDESERLFEEQNQIPVNGESLGSSSEDEIDSNSDYEKDSFVVSSDEDDNEMLSGTGDDLTLSDNELTQSAKSKKKYDERKVKEQKKASREMFEARHGVDSKKKSISEESEEETEVAMNLKRDKKRMRLNSSVSSQKSDIIEDEKEITMNNDVSLSKDPLSASVMIKEEPKSANITLLEAITEVEIDENKSMFVTKDKSCDPLLESQIQNDDESCSLTSENEEIANDYSKMLEVLNKCNELKRKHKSLGHVEKEERNDLIVDKLNLTKVKSKKQTHKITELTSQAKETTESNDIPNLNAHESKQTPQKDAVDNFEIPSSKKKKHKKCWEDNYNSESQNNSMEIDTNLDLESYQQSELLDSSVTSTLVTKTKKKKSKTSLNGSIINKSNSLDDAVSETANRSTTKAVLNNSKEISPQKVVIASNKNSGSSSDEIDIKLLFKDDSDVSELGEKNTDIRNVVAAETHLNSKTTTISNGTKDQNDKNSSKKKRRRRKRKEVTNNSLLNTSTSILENTETSKSDATEDCGTVSSTSQASEKISKSKKRRLNRKKSNERSDGVVETLKAPTVRKLPDEILRNLQEPIEHKKIVISTAAFNVDLVTKKRSKPSDTLDDSILLPEIPKATNNSGEFKVSKKSKVFPSIAGSASITGCTTLFQIVPINTESFKESTTHAMSGSSTFKEQYLYGGRIKRIASEQLTSKYKKIKTTKF